MTWLATLKHIEADSLKTARSRLTRIGLDLLGYFKTMGCVAHVMDGQARLEVLHGIFHPDGEPFRFDWDWLAPSGLSTKDFVAPSSLCFGTAKTFGLGGKYGAVSFLQILAPELSDEMLADFLKTESGILVNLHVQAIDQTEAIKTIKRKITDLDAMKIQEQKKAVRSGYDMDILPSDLATYGEDFRLFCRGRKAFCHPLQHGAGIQCGRTELSGITTGNTLYRGTRRAERRSASPAE